MYEAVKEARELTWYLLCEMGERDETRERVTKSVAAAVRQYRRGAERAYLTGLYILVVTERDLKSRRLR